MSMTTLEHAGDEAQSVSDRTHHAASENFNQSLVSLTEGASSVSAGLETTHAKVNQTMEKAMKTAEEMMSFNQGNIEAFVKSGQIWAAGFQDLSKQIVAHAQASLEDSLSTIRALSGVKSLKDAMELQTSFARSSMEKAVSETGRLTDASMRLAEQTFAPITARLTLTAEKFTKAA